MSRVESSARIEENDIHKSQWILSSTDLFLLSQAKIAVMEHEELTLVNSVETSLSLEKVHALWHVKGKETNVLWKKKKKKRGNFIF